MLFLTFFILVFLWIITIIVLVKYLDKEERDLIYSYYSRFFINNNNSKKL